MMSRPYSPTEASYLLTRSAPASHSPFDTHRHLEFRSPVSYHPFRLTGTRKTPALQLLNGSP